MGGSTSRRCSGSLTHVTAITCAREPASRCGDATHRGAVSARAGSRKLAGVRRQLCLPADSNFCLTCAGKQQILMARRDVLRSQLHLPIYEHGPALARFCGDARSVRKTFVARCSMCGHLLAASPDRLITERLAASHQCEMRVSVRVKRPTPEFEASRVSAAGESASFAIGYLQDSPTTFTLNTCRSACCLPGISFIS